MFLVIKGIILSILVLGLLELRFRDIDGFFL